MSRLIESKLSFAEEYGLAQEMYLWAKERHLGLGDLSYLCSSLTAYVTLCVGASVTPFSEGSR
jgi:hypothetical protein